MIRNKIFIKVRRTFPRIPGMFPEFQGHSQNSRDVSRIPGMFPEFRGHSQNSRYVPRIPGTFPEFQGCSQNSGDIPRIPGMFPEFQGCSKNSMDVRSRRGNSNSAWFVKYQSILVISIYCLSESSPRFKRWGSWVFEIVVIATVK